MRPSARRLWELLRGRRAGGFRFRREHVFPPYILDFYCAELRVAVEVDGGAHESGERMAYDERRDGFLKRAGVKVLRAPAQALLHRPEAVRDWIVSRCEAVAAEKAPPSRGASRSRHLPIKNGEER